MEKMHFLLQQLYKVCIVSYGICWQPFLMAMTSAPKIPNFHSQFWQSNSTFLKNFSVVSFVPKRILILHAFFTTFKVKIIIFQTF